MSEQVAAGICTRQVYTGRPRGHLRCEQWLLQQRGAQGAASVAMARHPASDSQLVDQAPPKPNQAKPSQAEPSRAGGGLAVPGMAGIGQAQRVRPHWPVLSALIQLHDGLVRSRDLMPGWE